MINFTYIGTELELFAQAQNWKKYIRFLLRRYIKGDVLEVGAGIGSNTKLLSRSSYSTWLCLEPDPKLFQALEYSIESHGISNCCAQNATLEALENKSLFDSILYLDVLEHIQYDKEEMLQAARHLKPGGHLIILGPAHQWLFTPFDTAIGHYRRYNKSTLKSVMSNDIEIIQFAYLDCIGLLASLGNKLILKQSQPSLKQIKTWDGFMVPLSRKLDRLLGYSLGKSFLIVGKKKFS